jgi:hypothetical protein
MSELDEYQRRRWMRPNAHLYIRHDAHRFMPPGSPLYVGKDVVKYFWPEPEDRPSAVSDAAPAQQQDFDPEIEAELAQLRCDVASLRLEWELAKFASRGCKAGFNPDQPRVPAGNPDGGQWTSEGGGGGTSGVRLAAADKVVIGAAAAAKILFEGAKKVIDAYRSSQLLWDMFKEPVGVVAHAEVEGEKIFGVNSQSPDNSSVDDTERDRLIARYMERNPDEAALVRRRYSPYDAFYHAETSLLLRAARRHGGSLAGREFDVFVDKRICNNCERILPFVGMEIGNPTVTFFDRRGRIGTIRDGIFHKAARR